VGLLLSLAYFSIRRESHRRHDIEAELARSQERYRVLVEHLPDAVLVAQGGRVSFANDALVALLGASSKASLLDRPIAEFMDEESLRDAMALQPNMAPAQRCWRTVEGGSVQCRVNVELITWNEAPATLCVVHDLTSLARSEAALRDTEARMAAIVSSAMDAIISIDLEQRIVLVNDAAERMFGIKAAEALGRDINCLIPNRFQTSHRAHVENFAKKGVTARRMGGNLEALVGLRSNGEEFPVEASISKAAVSGSQLLTVVLRDISGRKRREEELGVAQDRLTHMGRLSTMGEMAAGLSHEINQPLTAIATFAQALERIFKQHMAIDPEELKEIVAQISAQALRAGEVIRRMKAMVKNQAPDFTVLRCGDLVNDVKALAEVDARIHDVRMEIVVAYPAVEIWGNGVQIQQVLLNLIRNAIDASQALPVERRRIELKETASAETVRIEVTDHGVGVPAGEIDQLFRPFFTTKANGTGLGLAISRTILSAHQGRLDYEPTTGGGATFVIALPIHIESKA
jgi:two-component system sensor kinase FixL